MKIIKSYRKSISIMVDEGGEVIVKAPFFLSMKNIDSFVKSKESWIKKQQEKIQKKQKLLDKYDFYNNVYINNIEINWENIKNNNKKLTKVGFYTQKFKEEIVETAQNIARINNFGAVSFKLCNSKCIWGSCNAQKIIKLNWKLVILPENLQIYVICHELSHLKQMNHSQKFWQEVEYMDPKYKQNRKDLKEYSFLLRESIL